MKHSIATLDDLGVAEPEKNELLAVAGSFKADIVEVHVSRAGR